MSPLSVIPLRERLIIALDVPTAKEAQALIQKIGEEVVFYKVGLQLFTAEGPAIVRELVEAGKKVFLDLKVHEIPNTAASAVRSAAALGATMVTVHASGGERMLQAAVEAAHASTRPLMVLAVTVPTSLAEEDLAEIGIRGSAVEQVLRLAKLAQRAGCGGIVASPLETAELLRQLATGAPMVIVNPGIRPAGSARGDQSRTSTPAEAVRAGADYLVVGRPVSAAADPAEAVRAISAEMAAAGK